MVDKIVIQTGTRDELGGVDVAIANVLQRDERPGTLSGILIVDETEQIIAPGDKIELGGVSFFLEAINKHHTGAFEFVFVQQDISDKPDLETVVCHDISPIGAQELKEILIDLSNPILGLMGFGGEIVVWEKTRTDNFTKDMNGADIGPSIKHVFVAKFGSASRLDKQTEAVIRLEYIHWSPEELQCTEVSGFWRYGEKAGHVFSRGEKNDPVLQICANKASLPIVRMIIQSVEQNSN